MIRTSQLRDLLSIYTPSLVVLDCDGTLYPDIFSARRSFESLLEEYLKKKFSYTSEESREFVTINKVRFNTVSEIAACLQAGIDELEFNEEVIRKIPLDSIGIDRSFDWKQIPLDMPIVILTNNSSYFAQRISEELGIMERVIRIFGETELKYIRKPDTVCFEMVENFVESRHPVLYIDDDVSCLTIAKTFGWNTILPLYETPIPVLPTQSIDGILQKEPSLSFENR